MKDSNSHNPIQLDAFKSAEERDIGIEQAVDHADEVHRAWQSKAYDFLERFIHASTGNFMAEEVREAAIGIVPAPPSERAWGGIIRKAAVAGLIEKIGYRSVANVKAHRAPCGVWIKKTIDPIYAEL